MPPCSEETIRNIIRRVQGKEYWLVIYEPENGPSMYHVYTSNAQVDMYSGVFHNGLWRNFEFHAIELGD